MNLHRFLDTPIALQDIAAAELLERMRDRFAKGLKPAQVSYIDDNAIARDDARPYDVIQGVAVIPISGVLVHGTADWGETGYDTLQGKISEALRDGGVRAAALQMKSPGGEVSGLFELAEWLYSMRGAKPVWAILDDYAYSAAYAIASATDRITVPQTGGAGSIGVITMHLDISDLLEKNGVKVSIIQYGGRKSDYSLFKPLSDSARSNLQKDIDAVGEMFVEMVGRNRSLAPSRVRATEAGMYMGSDAVEQGIADAVMSPQAALESLIASI